MLGSVKQSCCLTLRSLRHLTTTNIAQNIATYDSKDGYSVLEMQKKPVNSASPEFMQNLIDNIDKIENNQVSRGIILTSSAEAFSAGIELSEIVNPDIERVRSFWAISQELHYRLYSSPLVTIAAINGSAVAGGCALTLCCDYRIMAQGRHKIGLNTVHTGLRVPHWVVKLLGKTVGLRESQKLLSIGHLCTPEEALQYGIIDDLVQADDLMSAATDEMKKWLSVPDVGRNKTKAMMRQDYLKEFNQYREEDIQVFCDVVCSDAFQNNILKYVERLKKK